MSLSLGMDTEPTSTLSLSLMRDRNIASFAVYGRFLINTTFSDGFISLLDSLNMLYMCPFCLGMVNEYISGVHMVNNMATTINLLTFDIHEIFVIFC